MTNNRNLNAALLALVSTAVLSFSDNFVSMVSAEAGLWQFNLIRSCFAIPVLLVLASFFNLSLRVVDLKMTVLRSLAVSTGLLIYFAALGFLPVAQAGAGLFSSPIWVLIFSAVVFGTKIRFRQVIIISIGFAGALMLLQPDMTDLSVLSVLPLTAGAFYGLGMLATRHWCAEESALTLAVGVFVTLGVISFIMLTVFTIWPVAGGSENFLLSGWNRPTPMYLLLTLGQAICSVIAVSLITQAYRIGDAAQVSVFEYSFLVFAALWTFIIWGQETNILAILGIIVIFISGAAVSFMSGASVRNPSN